MLTYEYGPSNYRSSAVPVCGIMHEHRGGVNLLKAVLFQMCQATSSRLLCRPCIELFG